MTPIRSGGEAAKLIGKHIPFLRRYGRALSGNQAQGDEIAAATLKAIMQVSDVFDESLDPKVALFSVFQSLWSENNAAIIVDEDTPMPARAQAHLAKLKSGSRDALLLKSLEQFTDDDIAKIMKIDVASVRKLLDEAYSDMAEAVSGRVLVIEDDMMVAHDLETVVTDMGHIVTGHADTHAAAMSLAQEIEPDLILADVVLADETSGIDAANEILSTYDSKPVIFVTGHPEKLLTGNKPEPTYLIPKPYLHHQVRAAVSQALFFASTEALVTSDQT